MKVDFSHRLQKGILIRFVIYLASSTQSSDSWNQFLW